MVSTATVRANGESLRGYIAIFRGAQVLTANLTADADAQSETSLSISITAGSIADVQRGYRVQFFTSGGDFKGESHIRWSGTLDSTNLPVREFSQSEFLLETGDVVKVFALTAFADKLVEDDILFNPDGKAVGTFNSAIAPLACSGGYDARFVDGFGTGTVQTYATITTDGGGSQALDPDSGGDLTHLWTLPTGVAFAPGSASSDASPTLRVNVGEYTVYHDVTDDDNSATWRQCVTYQVFSAASMPVPCLMDTPPMGDVEQGGWSCSFRALTPLTLEDAPDGSLAIFFVRQRINGTWQSLGARSGREHVKACGYLNHDESDLTPQETFQRFDLVSPFDRAGKLPGFSKIMIDTVSPDDWSEMETPLDTLRATVQIMRAYAWMLDGGHDLLVSDLYLNLPYPELALPKESPQQMVSDLADSVDAWFVCDRTGAFRLIPQFPLLSAADRAALTSAYTFDRRDILRMVMRRDHHDIVETLELHAVAATGDGSVAQATPVFSRAPGSPGHGAEFITVERIIADPDDAQNDANARAGRRYGMRNNVVTDASTGVKVRGLEVDLELRQVYDFLDFDDQIVRFASISNPRDIDLTALDWYFVRARLDYSSGRIISTFRALTDSPPGATYVPPQEASPPTDGQPPPYPFPPTQPSSGFPLGTGRYIVIDDNNQLFYTATGNGVSPVWALVPLSLTGTSTDFISDPFSPLYLNGSGDLWLRLTTTTRIYLLEVDTSDFSISATDQKTLPSAALYYRRIEMERGVPNFAAVLSLDTAVSEIKSSVTTDGSTWGSEVTVSTSASFYAVPGLFVSARAAGKLVTAESKASGAWVGKVSTNSGASYSTISSPAIGDSDGDSAFGLHFPYHNNSDESLCFYGEQYGGDGATRYRIIKVQGSTKTDISPTFGGSTGGVQHTRAIDSAPNNRLRLAACIRNGTTAVGSPADELRVGYCVDGGVSGSSWQFVTALDSTGGAGGCTFVRVLGDGSGFIAGGAGARLALCDFTGSARDISGNLAALGCGVITNVVGY